MLTPQAIKDQEFQQKFRGYDAIEVKAYLELLAEDYFELTEQIRVQAEDIDSLVAEKESFDHEKDRLAAELKASLEEGEEKQAEIREINSKNDDDITALKAEVDELKEKVDSLEGENITYMDLIADLELTVANKEGTATQEQTEIKSLRAQLSIVEGQNEGLKKEGVDFKTTILAAQKFADNLRETSEAEAKRIMDVARADVENYRNEMAAEMAMYPKKIEDLKQRKSQVRAELKNILDSYMEAIDVFSDSEQDEKEDDYSELFQSVQLPGGEDLDSDDLEELGIDLT